MTFTLDPDVAAVLAAAGDIPPMPAAGDVAGRRGVLNPMLDYFNNHVQPIAAAVTITDHQVETADGVQMLARWYRLASSDSSAAVLYLHGGGMIVGSVAIFDGPVSR